MQIWLNKTWGWGPFVTGNKCWPIINIWKRYSNITDLLHQNTLKTEGLFLYNQLSMNSYFIKSSSALMSRSERGKQGWGGAATPLTASTTLNNPPSPCPSPLCRLSSNSQQLVMSLHTRALLHMHRTHRNAAPSPCGVTVGTVKVGVPDGDDWTISDKESCSRLSQRRSRGHSAPRASVNDQQLSGVDSAPCPPIAQRAYATQPHSYRDGPMPISMISTCWQL